MDTKLIVISMLLFLGSTQLQSASTSKKRESHELPHVSTKYTISFVNSSEVPIELVTHNAGVLAGLRGQEVSSYTLDTNEKLPILLDCRHLFVRIPSKKKHAFIALAESVVKAARRGAPIVVGIEPDDDENLTTFDGDGSKAAETIALSDTAIKQDDIKSIILSKCGDRTSPPSYKRLLRHSVE